MSVSVKPLIDAGFGLKGLKKWNSRDGGGYQFALVFDKKTVAEVTNEGNGGEVQIDWIGLRWDGTFRDAVPTLEAKKAQVAKSVLDTVVKATPQVASYGTLLTVDASWFMEEMVNYADLVKVCKKKTAFRTSEDGDHSYTVVNAPFEPKVRAYVLTKWPAAVILNENLFA